MDRLSLSADAAAAGSDALGEWIATVLGPDYEITREQLPDCWALLPAAPTSPGGGNAKPPHHMTSSNS